MTVLAILGAVVGVPVLLMILVFGSQAYLWLRQQREWHRTHPAMD